MIQFDTSSWRRGRTRADDFFFFISWHCLHHKNTFYCRWRCGCTRHDGNRLKGKHFGCCLRCILYRAGLVMIKIIMIMITIRIMMMTILQDGLSGSLGNCTSTPTTTIMGNETTFTLLDSECITPSNCWILDVNSVTFLHWTLNLELKPHWLADVFTSLHMHLQTGHCLQWETLTVPDSSLHPHHHHHHHPSSSSSSTTSPLLFGVGVGQGQAFFR